MRHYKVSGGADIAKFAYGYSPASDRLYQQDLFNTSPHLDEFYTYDTLHRLTNFKRGELNANKDGMTGTPSREQTWTLDHVGNWPAIDSEDGGDPGSPTDARTHNTSNEILTIDPEDESQFSVVHDDAGNLAELPDRTDPVTKADRFTYDYRNRLIKVERTTTYDEQPPTWNAVVQYFYDGLNRRIKKDLTTGNDVVYLYDGWRCVEEREWDAGDEAWEPRRQYAYGGIYIDEPVLFDKDTDDDEDIDVSYWYLQDTNYNVVALADSTGATLHRSSVHNVNRKVGSALLVAPCLLAASCPPLFLRRRLMAGTTGRQWIAAFRGPAG